MSGRATSAIGTGILLLALLAVVSLAAGQRAPHGGGPARAHGLPPEFFDYAWTFGLVAGLPLLVLLLYARGRARTARDGSQGRLLSYLAACAVAVVLVLVVRPHWRIPESFRHPAAPAAATPPAGQGARRVQPESRSVRFKWIPVVLFGGVALGIGGTLWALSRVRPRPRRRLEQELVEVLDLGLDDLDARWTRGAP